MYRVFLSYSTHDLEWATYLKNLLADARASVFIAQYDVQPGQNLSDEIAREIKACDLFILLWSAESKASQYVGNEIFLANAERKRILPIMLGRDLRLPDMLSDLKYLPLTQNPQTALAWLKEHVTTSAQNKATSDMVGLALMAFIGWAVIRGK